MVVALIGLLYCYLISWHVSAVQNTLDVAYYTHYIYYMKYIDNNMHILIVLNMCSRSV